MKPILAYHKNTPEIVICCPHPLQLRAFRTIKLNKKCQSVPKTPSHSRSHYEQNQEWGYHNVARTSTHAQTELLNIQNHTKPLFLANLSALTLLIKHARRPIKKTNQYQCATSSDGRSKVAAGRPGSPLQTLIFSASLLSPRT